MDDHSEKRIVGLNQEHKMKGTKNRRTKSRKIGRLQFQNKFIRVLRGKHNNLGLTHNGRCILNSLVNDIFDRLTAQAIQLQRSAKRKTLTHHDMASACSLMLKGNLQNYAKAAGTKAVVQYLNSFRK